MAPNAQSPVTAFRAALDLYEVGVNLMRQNLRRQYPCATPADIESRLGNWLRHRPGAEFGDCPGRAVDGKAPLA